MDVRAPQKVTTYGKVYRGNGEIQVGAKTLSSDSLDTNVARRKQTHIKQLGGNAGQRPLKPEPPVVEGKPTCPTYLDKVARAEFKRMADLLDRMGVLSQTDRTILATYAVAYSRWVRAEQEVQRTGEVQVAKTGWLQKSAWLSVADKAFDQLQKTLLELGLTPASRHKANVIPKTEASKWDGLIGGVDG